MANVDLSIFLGAFPSITTNDIRIEVSIAGSYPAVYQSQQFSPPHPQRTVMFAGLPRQNYIFRVLEMSGSSTSIVVAVKGRFDVVPDNDSIKFKDPVLIQANVTTGFTSGGTSVTFDGSGGTDDWRGYEMYPERIGMGTMKRGVDYTWDKTTGTFVVIAPGDTFQPLEYFNCTFGIIATNSASGVGGGGGGGGMIYTGQKIITGTDSIVAADAGKKIIIRGSSNYFVVSLPDISTVTELTPFFIESSYLGNNIKCVRFQCFGSNIIDFGIAEPNIKIGRNESFVIYREKATAQWRIDHACGNFLTVGRIISTDAEIDDEFNCVEADGSSVSVNDYARLYEDFVLKLPPAQVCNYADHSTENNKYKYSFSSGGFFYLPDRRSIYLRNNDGSTIPGDYQASQVGQYLDTVGNHGDTDEPPLPNTDTYSAGAYHFKTKARNVGLKTRPETVIVRQFILT